VLRTSADTLTAAALQALRDGYSKMQALAPSDNRSWFYWAGIHGVPQWLCWHHGRVGRGGQRPLNLFLPWHRAYLSYFENSMRDRNGAAVVPWWDWTSATSHTNGLPRSFSQATAGGAANPLYNGPVPNIPGVSNARRTTRFPGRPTALPTVQDIAALMRLPSFEDFTARLEDIHDGVHGWTGGVDPGNPRRGGDMGTVAFSAYDPIFWSHHCMIDRLWYIWQVRYGVNNIPQEYLAQALAPFNLTVRDVLDIHGLGYEYAVGSTP
jgi:tyrosinase